jgi:hypothetical protein
MLRSFKLILIVALLCSCSHEQHKTKPTSLLQRAEEKGERIYAHITDDIYIQRCDKLTFKALLSVYREQNVSGFEHPAGVWHRDNSDCYPEFSRSSISFDGILSVLHHAVSTNDLSLLDRLINYGNDVEWILGEGPREYTDMHLLVPMIFNLRYNVLTLSSVEDALSGFRGHLLASYIWLSLRTDGKLNDLELQALKELVDASPDDPMYVSLLHRATDGEQKEALETLLSHVDFEEEGIYGRDGVFGWGSAPASVYYLITLAIIKGD